MLHKNYNLIIILILIPIASFAGQLDSQFSPTDKTSAMYSIDDICNRLTSGTNVTKQPFTNPTSGPENTQSCTLNDLMDKAPKNNSKGAKPNDVTAGKKYWGLVNSNWGFQTGTLSNTTNSCKDSNLKPKNIKKGVTICGITGTFAKTTISLPGTTFQDTLSDDSLGPQMVWIPPGSFTMGDTEAKNQSELPVHKVTIDSFAIGVYEVTFAEYDKFVKATGRNKPNDEDWGRENRPVINVYWQDAVAYTEWLTQETGNEYRLPSEAEWEYMARAETKTVYWWGDKINENKANCDGCNSKWDNKKTAPVGSFKPNKFGIYDTAGNVFEWCADNWHDNYKEAPNDGSVWKGNDPEFVIRGGAWSYFPNNARVSFRFHIKYFSKEIGFRVVKTN
ncbi:MAG: formylglycine-generating enzyme family protein [Candidatus Marithrix sp.]